MAWRQDTERMIFYSSFQPVPFDQKEERNNKQNSIHFQTNGVIGGLAEARVQTQLHQRHRADMLAGLKQLKWLAS